MCSGVLVCVLGGARAGVCLGAGASRGVSMRGGGASSVCVCLCVREGGGSCRAGRRLGGGAQDGRWGEPGRAWQQRQPVTKGQWP